MGVVRPDSEFESALISERSQLSRRNRNSLKKIKSEHSIVISPNPDIASRNPVCERNPVT
jgi:hypothetical protein